MKSKPKQVSRLRRLNNVLSILVALFAVYLIAWPFLPQVDYWWNRANHNDPPLVKAVVSTKISKTEVPKDNILVIPAIHLQQTIYGGYPYSALDKGVWRSPQGSSPDKGSNTVIAGHRFTYHGFQRGGAAFYNLDKLKAGDQIVIFWQGIRYDYSVLGNTIVPPTDLSIEKGSETPQLTLYTCTPLWTSTNRLVITAKLIPRGNT